MQYKKFACWSYVNVVVFIFYSLVMYCWAAQAGRTMAAFLLRMGRVPCIKVKLFQALQRVARLHFLPHADGLDAVISCLFASSSFGCKLMAAYHNNGTLRACLHTGRLNICFSIVKVYLWTCWLVDVEAPVRVSCHRRSCNCRGLKPDTQAWER